MSSSLSSAILFFGAMLQGDEVKEVVAGGELVRDQRISLTVPINIDEASGLEMGNRRVGGSGMSLEPCLDSRSRAFLRKVFRRTCSLKDSVWAWRTSLCQDCPSKGSHFLCAERDSFHCKGSSRQEDIDWGEALSMFSCRS